MQKNKNGIPVETKADRRKRKPRKPLEHCIDMVRYSTVVEGIPVEITIPNFSPFRAALEADGWSEEILTNEFM